MLILKKGTETSDMLTGLIYGGIFLRGPIISKHTWLRGSYFEKYPDVVSNTVDIALHLALAVSILAGIYQFFYIYIYSDFLDKTQHHLYKGLLSSDGSGISKQTAEQYNESCILGRKATMGKYPQALSGKRDKAEQSWARNTFNDKKQHSGTC